MIEVVTVVTELRDDELDVVQLREPEVIELESVSGYLSIRTYAGTNEVSRYQLSSHGQASRRE